MLQSLFVFLNLLKHKQWHDFILNFHYWIIVLSNNCASNSISFSHINGVKYFLLFVYSVRLVLWLSDFILVKWASGSTMIWYIASAVGVLLGFYCFTFT